MSVHCIDFIVSVVGIKFTGIINSRACILSDIKDLCLRRNCHLAGDTIFSFNVLTPLCSIETSC